MSKILLIIPAYNEEESIKRVYNEIVSYNKKNNTNYDVIVINDGSTDNTEEILIENNIPHISLVSNLGIGGAVQTGYKYAYEKNYDIAIQFDGDGQHDINYVKNIIKPILNGQADMVIGSRFIDDKANFKSSRIRRVGISIISFLIKILTGKKIYDTTSGFRASNKKVIEIFQESYPPEYPEPVTTTRVLKKKLRVSEVHAKMKERKAGKSSLNSNLWVPVYYMINVCLSIIIEALGGYKI